MMKIWGMLTAEDEAFGFDLVMDDDWMVVLLKDNLSIMRFDPRDYTSRELLSELGAIIRLVKSDIEVS